MSTSRHPLSPSSCTPRELALQLLFHPNGLAGVGLVLQAIDPARMYKARMRSENQSVREGYAPYDTGTSGFMTNKIILYYGTRPEALRVCLTHGQTVTPFCGYCGAATQSARRPDEFLWRVRWLPYGCQKVDIPLTSDRATAEAAVDALLQGHDCTLLDAVVPYVTEEEYMRYAEWGEKS